MKVDCIHSRGVIWWNLTGNVKENHGSKLFSYGIMLLLITKQDWGDSMLWNVDFEISAAIILVIIVLYYFTSKRMVTRQSNSYSLMLILSLAGVVLNFLQRLMLLFLMDIPLVAHHTIGVASLMLSTVVYFLMFYYVRLVVVHPFAKNRYVNSLFYLPMMGSFLILVGSYAWPIGFDVNYHEGLVYHWSIQIVYLSWLFYAGVSYYEVVCNHTKLQFHQRLTFLLSMLFTICALFLKLIYPRTLLISLSFSVTLLLVYFVIENPRLSTDELTGLFNRQAFMDRLENNVKRKEPFHIIMIAMDDFRFVNETYGYHYGDLLLKAIGKKLLDVSNVVYRYMGDTFCVVVQDDASVMQIINRIKSRLDVPWNINSTVCLLSASFCVVSFPQNAETTAELVDFIDFTIHEAKKVAKGSITFGKNSSKDKIVRNNAIEFLLKDAIQNDRFEVHYQPIYSQTSKRFVAAEALVRLYDEELGLISPAEFIPIAEKNGSILKIGIIVFEKVCQLLQKHQLASLGVEYIEVNLSVLQCMQRRLPVEMIEIMQKYEIDPSMINFELTESAVAESKGMLETTMNELIGYGCQFSLDDFGTGYSNISYVTQLPFSIVKIDKGLVWTALGNDQVKVAISHLISMFKKMNMKIVAEGVETKQQLDMLTAMECDFIQGYYFAKPMPVDEFVKLLQNNQMIPG